MGRKITDIPNSLNDNLTDYPRGYVANASGSFPGTTGGEQAFGDMHQFFAKLMADAIPTVVPNSLPDNETNGYQYFEAFINYVRNVLVATTTAKGTVEKATTAERDAGTADKYIDAALLQGQVGSWQNPSYNAGFSSGTDALKYRLNRKKLEFKGDMNATLGGGVAFALPVGYRPSTVEYGIFISGTTLSFFFINAIGEVYVSAGASWNTVGSNSFNSIIIID